MTKIKFKGFTLIELLVVIAIIGVLSTLAVVSLNSARQKARDAKRVADIKQIQTALELYYNDNNGYPVTTGTLGVAGRILCAGSVTAGFITANGDCGGTTYMGAVPSNPSPGGSAYIYEGAASTYSIEFALETTVGNLNSGGKVATPDGVSDAVAE